MQTYTAKGGTMFSKDLCPAGSVAVTRYRRGNSIGIDQLCVPLADLIEFAGACGAQGWTGDWREGFGSLPDKGVPALVQLMSGQLMIARLSADYKRWWSVPGDYSYRIDRTLRWMPLPAPPAEAGEGKKT